MNFYTIYSIIVLYRRTKLHQGVIMANAKEYIESGRTALGIEFGSTRIKAILVDENNTPIASGSHEWENQHIGGIWTYSLDAIREGLQDCYARMAADVKEK